MSDIDIFAKTTSCVDIKNDVVSDIDFEIMKLLKEQNEELSKKLEKLERAFEILKKNIVPNQDIESLIDIMVWREDNAEEYELLEELMKDE